MTLYYVLRRDVDISRARTYCGKVTEEGSKPTRRPPPGWRALTPNGTKILSCCYDGLAERLALNSQSYAPWPTQCRLRRAHAPPCSRLIHNRAISDPPQPLTAHLDIAVL